MPMIKGPFTFIVTSRGCPAGCKYCIKHVTYQNSVRVRSAENIVEELELLGELGIHNIHMYADLFTVNREHVVEPLRADHRAGPEDSTGPATAGSTMWTRRCCTLMGEGRLLADLLGHRERQRADPEARTQGLQEGAGIHGADMVAGRPASRTGATSSSACPARPRSRSRRRSPTQETAAGHRPLPHRRALSGHAVLLRGGGEQLVPAGHQVGRGGHGPVDRAGLRQSDAPSGWSTGRSERRGNGRSVPARSGPSSRGLNSWEGAKSAVNVGWQMMQFTRS